MTYLEPIEPPDRRFKERILESELQHLKLVEVQAKHKQDQAMVRAAWHKEQVEQRRQEEVDLERRPANQPRAPPASLGPIAVRRRRRIDREKRKWMKRKELEVEVLKRAVSLRGAPWAQARRSRASSAGENG